MLNPDPKKRLTAQEVLVHPWLRNSIKAPNMSLGETIKTRQKQFVVMNKLKKRALRVIEEFLPVEEVAVIKEVFQLMDTSNNGKINLEELKIGLNKLGQEIPDTDLQILTGTLDNDGDVYLEYWEFLAISFHLRKMGNDEHLRKAFEFFDQNQSGFIELKELRHALSDEFDGGEDVICGIMHDVDTDKDGKISYKEFAAMMKAGTNWARHQES